MKVIESPREFQRNGRDRREDGLKIALVPTMGYLHEGHLSLMREGRRRADVLAVSIFVNPSQFGPNEDLARYPRDLQGDLDKCRQVDADLVFTPPAGAMYPEGFQTWVEVAELQKGLCGARRPGHFRGVATVVCKLLNLARPHLALFGEKDYQQLQILRRMAKDLDMDVEVAGMPIVREPDGLAMSSRNAYLTPDERKRATALWRGLQRARALFAQGETEADPLRSACAGVLEQDGARIDYVELCDPATLEPQPRARAGDRMLVAAFLGNTRLIDNAALG
jgi:pantoate--beta-alanine ligase